MKNRIEILSRKDAEFLIKNDYLGNTAAISFYDPHSKRTPKDYAPVDYKNLCAKVFYVGVPDIDIEILSDYGLTYNTYLPEAAALAEFIISAAEEELDIICQCEYGQSRSAACAAAIKEYFDGNGIEVFADYRYYPNQLIFNKVLNALKERGAKKADD